MFAERGREVKRVGRGRRAAPFWMHGTTVPPPHPHWPIRCEQKPQAPGMILRLPLLPPWQLGHMRETQLPCTEQGAPLQHLHCGKHCLQGLVTAEGSPFCPRRKRRWGETSGEQV